MSLRVSDEEYAALRAKTGVTSGVTLVKGERKANKYRNKVVVVDGVTYDSLGEYRRWVYLSLAQERGEITHLQHHVALPIYVNDVEICYYEADFVYFEDGGRVVEDYKGKKTDLYILKRKLVEAVYGIRIREVTKR